GIVSATRQYTIWDNVATLVSLIGVSMPVFWLGLMLVLLFSVALGWLPSSGAGTPAQLVLPALALGSASTAIIARQTRSGLLGVGARRDLAVVQTTIMLVSGTFGLVDLLVGLLVGQLDPRLRYG